MYVELKPEEADLLRSMLLAEIESKRVELHHARNMDFKSELRHQERVLQDILQRID